MSSAKLSVDYFKSLLGDENVLIKKEDTKEYESDWTNCSNSDSLCVLFPKTTIQVSKTLEYCSKNNLTVVPSGGRTGMAGGAVSFAGQVVLSLAKMNKIIDIDPVGMVAKVEAGVSTQDLQEEARRHGLFYGVDLGARGSCHLGGNINTNAGGLKYIRYRGTREQVLGLETVLANGEVLDLNRSLHKNNTGYNLAQLFVGSEGTLGIVTKATLRLYPQPKALELSCLGVESFKDILNLLHLSHEFNLHLTAFEFFSKKALSKVRNQFSIREPFSEDYPYFVLVEVEDVGAQNNLDSFLEKAFEKGFCRDGVRASSSEESSSLWSLRENITESLAVSGFVRKNDICLEINKLDEFVIEINLLAKKFSKIDLVLFGHVGDGNLHVNYHSNKGSCNKEDFLEHAIEMEKEVFRQVSAFGGSISAEHGVGILKKDDLHFTCSELEISIMRGIKQVFDPKGILNPGKIFDAK